MRSVDKLPGIKPLLTIGLSLLLSGCFNASDRTNPTTTPLLQPTPLPNTEVIVKAVTRSVFGYYDDRFRNVYGQSTTTEKHILNAGSCNGGTRVEVTDTLTGIIEYDNGDTEYLLNELASSFGYCK